VLGIIPLRRARRHSCGKDFSSTSWQHVLAHMVGDLFMVETLNMAGYL
jgi:hypothetical protein